MKRWNQDSPPTFQSGLLVFVLYIGVVLTFYMKKGIVTSKNVGNNF